MRIVIAAIGVVLGGCSTSTADPDVAHQDRPVMFASDAAVPADCATQLRALAGKVRSAYVAMDATSSRRAAKELWTAMPETCRKGAWYLAAARLVAIDVKPLVAGSVTIDDEKTALVGALGQPADADVLARVALVAAIGREPGLPANACDSARGAVDKSDRNAGDLATYVCARAAIVAGDGKRARIELVGMYDAKRFLDIDLVRAQAAKLAGDTKAMKDSIAAVNKIDQHRAANAYSSPVDVAAIIDVANKLGK